MRKAREKMTQKYIVIYKDAENTKYEVFDFKAALNKRIKNISRDSILCIMRGRKLAFVVEEKLKVG